MNNELKAYNLPHIDVPSHIKTLVTDSRNHFDPSTALFFAIKTENGNDGHKYIPELYAKGVRYFVVQYIPEELKDKEDAHFIVVKDSVKALAEIAVAGRKNAGEVVGITGSRGKTTLKEMLYQLMEPYKKISRSPRSYNSKIGVPLSLWQIIPHSDIALIEAGISQKGEMAHLEEIIKPDTVIFTNIGDAHAQGFESKIGKAQEKAILARGCNVDTIIYPRDCKLISDAILPYSAGKNFIGWSIKDTSAPLFLKFTFETLEYTWKNKTYRLNISISKDYDIENIASALAFMLKEGFNEQQISQAFSRLHRINTRLNVSEGINGCNVILDSYTSDLSSLIPAIDFMARRRMPHQSLTLIMSDLKYEGQSVEDTYKEMAEIVRTTGIDKFIGIGKTLEKFSCLFPKGEFYPDTNTFLQKVSASDFNDEIILLKGSPDSHFENIFSQLEAKKHETVLEVNLDALLRNYNYFKSLIPSSTGIVAMVKASGYGAGSYEIAKTLQDAGVAYLAVAALDEGIDLRRNGIRVPVMVMNPKAANYRALFNHNLQPVIYTLSMLELLSAEADKYEKDEYPIHLKLDTGMHRMGFEEKDLDTLIEILKGTHNIKVASVFSHLATADCIDMDEFTYRQLDKFQRMSDYLIEKLGYPIKRHILNSAGILRFPQYHYELVRLGIGLYGANTLPANIEKPLSTVSTLRTVIICIRFLKEGEAVGYSRKGEIKGERKIATLPIGYADGMNRKFGNGALKVMVNGHLVPTIGNICMDATMIDVTGVECNEGDSVEIFGENISVQTLADTLDTIPYEILTSVSPRVKRVYYRE